MKISLKQFLSMILSLSMVLQFVFPSYAFLNGDFNFGSLFGDSSEEEVAAPTFDTALTLEGTTTGVWEYIEETQDYREDSIHQGLVQCGVDSGEVEECELFLAQVLLNQMAAVRFQEQYASSYYDAMSAGIESFIWFASQNGLLTEEDEQTLEAAMEDIECLGTVVEFIEPQVFEDVCRIMDVERLDITEEEKILFVSSWAEMTGLSDMVWNEGQSCGEMLLAAAAREGYCRLVEENFLRELMVLRKSLAVDTWEESFQPDAALSEYPVMTNEDVKALLPKFYELSEKEEISKPEAAMVTEEEMQEPEEAEVMVEDETPEPEPEEYSPLFPLETLAFAMESIYSNVEYRYEEEMDDWISAVMYEPENAGKVLCERLMELVPCQSIAASLLEEVGDDELEEEEPVSEEEAAAESESEPSVEPVPLFVDGQDVIRYFLDTTDREFLAAYLCRLQLMCKLILNVNEDAETVSHAIEQYEEAFLRLKLADWTEDMAQTAAWLTLLQAECYGSMYDQPEDVDADGDLVFVVMEGPVQTVVNNESNEQIAALGSDEYSVTKEYEPFLYTVSQDERTLQIVCVPLDWKVEFQAQESGRVDYLCAKLVADAAEETERSCYDCESKQTGTLNAQNGCIEWEEESDITTQSMPIGDESTDTPNTTCEHSSLSVFFDWDGGFKKCTATFSCKDCDTVEKVTCSVEVGFENEKQVEYVATAEFGGKEYQDTKSIEKIVEEKTTCEHSSLSVFFDWDGGFKKCTAVFGCRDCGHVVKKVKCSVDVGFEDEKQVEYVATAKFESEEYQDTKSIKKAVHKHSYVDPEFFWAENHESCVAVFTCGGCKDQQVIAASVKVSNNAAGAETIYRAKVSFNGKTYEDVQTVSVAEEETAPVHTHHYQAAEFQWAEDHSECKAVFRCSEDTHYEERTCDIVREEEPLNGVSYLTARVVFEGRVYENKISETMTVEHCYSVEFVWAEDYSRCLAQYQCTDCGKEGSEYCQVSFAKDKQSPYYLAVVTIDEEYEFTSRIYVRPAKNVVAAAILMLGGLSLIAVACFLIYKMKF